MAIPIYVFEDSQMDRLYPLTYTRPAFMLRCGALTILERIARSVAAAGEAVSGVLVRDVLAPVLRDRVDLPVNPAVSTKEGVILINGRWLPVDGHGAGAAVGGAKWDAPLADSAGVVADAIAWVHLSAATAAKVELSRLWEPKTLETILPQLHKATTKAAMITHPWDLLTHQKTLLRADFAGFGGSNEAKVMHGAHLLAPENIFLGHGVKVWPGVVLDAQNGPIIVEEGTEIRANAVITGPVHIGKYCVVRTGADIRELTSLGPMSRVGGEVMHSIFLGNANKQHHGFVGQSIIGEWANLGAGTTTSNLKNTYGTIRVPINGIEEETGLQFMGSVIGDHAKLGIGTYLSTGTVVGFASHVVTARPPKFVPSFSWVAASGVERANFEKLEAIAETVMNRRGVEFTAAHHELFVRIAGEASGEKYAWGNT